LTSETFVAAELYLFDSNSWSSLVMAILDIGNGHWRIIWTYTHIFIGDIAQVSHKRVLFLKPDIMVTVREGKYYSSVTRIEYGWVPEVRDSYQFTSEVSQYYSRVPDTRYCSRISNVQYCSGLVDVPIFSQDADATYLACHYYAALPRSVIVVVYCTKQ